ncbi:M-phase inducer phosphatase [Condylostylus longicornis]|uniref:M-phase inducer phosphatase n=1 Tax=Condylostylus longicornis TaxID=2530218 RepID=UPI00244DDBF7|nr:M-phase inducer phosphatase [Condylostylus longicornis]
MEENVKMENLDPTFISRNFLNYRTKNEENSSKFNEMKEDEKFFLFHENCVNTTGADSAYQSAYSNLSTPTSILSSSQFSTYSSSITQSFNSTKNSYKSQSNIFEDKFGSSISKNDLLTLTPVTQNAKRISAFHITTPRSDSHLSCITKRPSNYSLVEFQSTPKKLKSSNCDIYSTPQKHKKEKGNLFKRLHSAPDFENNSKDDDIKSWKTPAQSTPKRNPLQPIQQRGSSTPKNTPINTLKRNLLTTPLNKINENSLNDLLNCSNDAFESILNSDALNSPRKTKLVTVKRLNNVLSDENNLINCALEINKKASCKTFRRFLKFSSQNNSLSILNDDKSILENENVQAFAVMPNKRKTHPAIHSVIQDRLKAKKRINAERLAELNGKNLEVNFEKSKNTPDQLCQSNKNEIVNNISFQNNSIDNSKKIDINSSPKCMKIKLKNFITETPVNSTQNINMDITPPCNESKNIVISNIESCDMDVSPIETNFQFKKLGETDLMNETKLHLIEENSLDDFMPLTPPLNKFGKDDDFIYLENSAENGELEKSSLTTPPRTSIRSTSTSSQKCSLFSIDKERFEILYPTIPETPKKKFKNNSPKKSPKKNKKIIIKSKPHTNRIFYNGCTYLNIIGKLELYTIVLEKIFYYLSDEDLLNLSMTTKVYRRILHDNYKTNLRLIKFIRDYKVRKENYCKQSHFDNINSCNDNINNYNNNYNKIKPFTLHNEKLLSKRDSKNNLVHDKSLNKSPTASPSKRKFHEYQKIIKNLSNNENMGKCPRCAMASYIINQPPLDSFPELDASILNNREIKFKNINNDTLKSIQSQQKQQYFFQTIDEENKNLTTDLLRRSSLKTHSVTQNSNNEKMKLKKAFSVDSWQGQLRKNRLLQEISKFQPYGECTSIKCKFKYCLECFCDYHPMEKCKLTASVSPSKEDVQNGILEIMKSPKRNNSGINYKSSGSRNLNMKRKSLKRLCFN